MFDIGWAELLVIGVVALIVIGPKDLPEMFRTLGRFTAKARGMARDFQRAMETAADETGVKDVAKDIKSATSAKSMGLDAVKDVATKFEAWDPIAKKTAAKTTTAAAMTSTIADEAAADALDAADLGPATKALADMQIAKRAERAAATKAKKAEAASASLAKPAGPPKAKAAAKTPSAKAASPKPEKAASAKPARKAPVKKGDA